MSKYIFNNDTDILEFLEQLRENGIQIWGEGEKIRYRSKNRQLAPETLRILKMAKGQILDFFRMIEKNVIPLTSIQTAYVVGQTAGCELGNINAHYYMGGIVSRNFDLLSEGFVKARYAVFRYDKRENYDIEIIIRDAREVTRFVSGLSEVEGILFYGWSEGVRVCTTLL